MRVNQAGSSPIQSTEAKKTAGTQVKGKSSGTDAVQNKSVDTSGVKTEISAQSKELARVKGAASQAPDIREEKVAELRKRIEEGQYNVKPEAIADRLVDDHVRMAELS